mmetsp:Transcript_25029/g.64621  ORF Transcript_25029/g.64621 Transcript_25029/m.64621 type:complete len:213 (+) Transcript_25029:20-658(+)
MAVDDKKHSRKEKHKRGDKRDKHEKSEGHDRRDKSHRKKDKEHRDRSERGRHKRSKREPSESSGDDGHAAVWVMPTVPPPGGAVLTPESYFEFATEFRVWLLETKGIYLDELPSGKARALFALFGRAWNDGQLERKFYDRLPETQLAASVRTRHVWAFSTKMSDADRLALESTKDSVDTATNRAAAAAAAAAPSGPVGARSTVKGPAVPPPR